MRLAIITGGSKGLGAALCDNFIQQGFRVVEFSRSAPHPYSIHADLAMPELSQDVIAKALANLAGEPWQEIVIINNAGVLDPIGPVSRKDRSAIIANINTNFTSALLFLADAVAQFQSHPARKTIVNVSSGAALNGYAGWSLYCAAKAGLENFIRALAAEQQAEPFPIVPINIIPGVIDTGMQAAIRQSAKADFPDVDRFIQRRDNGELRAPAEVAAAIARIVAMPFLNAGARYNVSDYGC